MPRHHVLTIAVEDYFQVASAQQVVDEGQWYRFESRVERNVRKTLQLLDETQHTATFFVLGWIAEQMPEVIRLLAERGHEVATQGYTHRGLAQMTPEEFRDGLVRSREALAKASGLQIHGHRIAQNWFGKADLWALDVLAEEGFAYDSSLRPLLRSHRNAKRQRFAYEHSTSTGSIWEFPIATWGAFGFSIPIAGGNHQRQLPHALVRSLVADWHRRYDAPYVKYFHIWDLDPDQPRIAGTSWVQRIRQYRNLGRMEERIRYFLDRYEFQSIADHLGLERDLSPGEALALDLRPETWDIVLPDDASAARPRITIVVPCFNEAEGLPYLANTLRSVEAELAPRYRVTFIFVDDGSQDGTWSVLNTRFGARSNYRLRRHDKNRGIAAAIRTGTEAADTDIVATIDADCTYDPHRLLDMLDLLDDDIDLVTASPYHRDGTVKNVPEWRLFLSRGLSRIYGWILPQRLATYTSCFRVFRRGSMLGLPVRHDGFLGVAESLALLMLAGGRIVEMPATLESRVLGTSKMKVLRTIWGHLGLVGRLLRRRLRG